MFMLNMDNISLESSFKRLVDLLKVSRSFVSFKSCYYIPIVKAFLSMRFIGEERIT